MMMKTLISAAWLLGSLSGHCFCSPEGHREELAVASGAKVKALSHRRYDTFGEVIRSTGPMAKAPLRFSTKYPDDETDLLYYGYRYYNASTGRWLSRDPLGDEAFLKDYSSDKDEMPQMLLRVESLKPSYVFTLNQAVSTIDRSGLDRWKINWIHSWVVVEEWDKCCSKLVGYKRIEFTPRGGWGSVIIIGTGGFVAPGEVLVTSTTKPSGWAPNHIPSSCAADKFLLAWANAMADAPPFYSVWAFNCRHFAAIAQMMGIDQTAP